MFRKLPGVKKPESPVVWIFGLFILYLSKKIERRRNAVLTKTKGFYDSGIIPKQKVYMMQRAYRRIYKSVGTEKRMVSRIQGSKIGNEKISTRTGNHKNISE